MSRLRICNYFQGVYCNIANHRFYIIQLCSITDQRPMFLHNLWCCNAWSAIHTVNSVEITLILQPDLGDVKIGPAGEHGNSYL